MNFSIAALLILLLLLPGVGFITGVNFADKNVREIVFRHTPAELGYVIFVSLCIHLGFAAWFVQFNAASLGAEYAVVSEVDFRGLARDTTKAAELAQLVQRGTLLLRDALFYFLVTAVVGLILGVLLGRGVLLAKAIGWNWPLFLAKHRWMLDLVGTRPGEVIYARVLVHPYFTREATGSKTTMGVVVEGVVSDPFFDANGTLLYLVFKTFRETTVTPDTPPVLGGARAPIMSPDEQAVDQDTLDVASTGRTARNGDAEVDQLVIEGKWIVMARYERVDAQALTGAGVSDELDRMLARDRVTPLEPQP